MFYLLVKVSFAYLLPVSLKSLCFSVLSRSNIRMYFASRFYLLKDNFAQCYSVLCDFHPTANDNYVT